MTKKTIEMSIGRLRKIFEPLIKTEMKLMVKRVCEEEGLGKNETKNILAIISCESGFFQHAINVNKGGSTDFGICQFNNWWSWTKEKVIHPHDAMRNPEKAVRIMVGIYKKYGIGKNGLGRWVCWSGGFFKDHIDKV